MPTRSAGLLLVRPVTGPLGTTPISVAARPSADAEPAAYEVLLGHLGGPLWARRDERAWTIPKGELEAGESAWDGARREFSEELGLPVPDGPTWPLGEVRQSGGKIVTAWAVEADLDPSQVVPGTFTMTWPPRSGREATFPELDRVAWFAPMDAEPRIIGAQQLFLDRLAALRRA